MLLVVLLIVHPWTPVTSPFVRSDNKGLILYYQNAHSVEGKLSYLKSNLYQLSLLPDIIVITETWLKTTVLSSELGLRDFNIFRRDRILSHLGVSKGGGVMIAVRKHIAACEIPVDSAVEQLFIRISSGPSKIIIGVSYFAQTSDPQSYAEHALMVDSIANRQPGYKWALLGDYNLPHLSWSDGPPLQAHQLAYTDPGHRMSVDYICSTYSSLDLAQHFPEHPTKGYTLDLLFASTGLVTHLDLNEELLRTDSHHAAGFFRISESVNASYEPSFHRRNFFAADYHVIANDLGEVDWSDVLSIL